MMTFKERMGNYYVLMLSGIGYPLLFMINDGVTVNYRHVRSNILIGNENVAELFTPMDALMADVDCILLYFYISLFILNSVYIFTRTAGIQLKLALFCINAIVPFVLRYITSHG